MDSTGQVPKRARSSLACSIEPQRASTEQTTFVDDVRAAVDAIKRQELRKVVLARATVVELPKKRPPVQQVRRDCTLKIRTVSRIH
ncbi:MAG TPA: hypothetical protein VJV79_34290 [Polyangiaceae bacterium]|nr:hypothetical protein [Polyangiaceae bacterium]